MTEFEEKKRTAINNAIISMNELQKAVKLLFDAGGQEVIPFPKWLHTGPSKDQKLYRNLVREEYQETEQAYQARDPVEFVDGLCDLIWVTIGWSISMNLPLGDCWKEVVEANLNKIGLNGKVIRDENGKIMKPVGWTPPNGKIEEILKVVGWDGQMPRKNEDE